MDEVRRSDGNLSNEDFDRLHDTDVAGSTYVGSRKTKRKGK